MNLSPGIGLWIAGPLRHHVRRLSDARPDCCTRWRQRQRGRHGILGLIQSLAQLQLRINLIDGRDQDRFLQDYLIHPIQVLDRFRMLKHPRFSGLLRHRGRLEDGVSRLHPRPAPGLDERFHPGGVRVRRFHPGATPWPVVGGFQPGSMSGLKPWPATWMVRRLQPGLGLSDNVHGPGTLRRP